MFIKSRYQGANAYVDMTEGIDRSMLASLGQRRRRRFLTAIWLVLILFVAGAWFASRPAAFQWLSRVAPPIAHLLRPSAGSQEENGIRLEIAEVTRQGDTLRVHLTMEDLQGDRLGGGYSPEWWEYRQDRAASGLCTRKYDPETGLLHLYLTCDPAEDMEDFDWERWVTLTLFNLRARSDQSRAQVPIPLTLTDCSELKYSTVSNISRLEEYRTAPVASIQEGRDITCMTVIGDEFHVQVHNKQTSGLRDYQLMLTGPHGEQVQMTHRVDSPDYHCWVFALRDRDIRDCTLTAWVDSDELIEGTWTIQVSPITEDRVGG